MAKSKKQQGNAAAKGKARKARPHVVARRAKRVAKKQTKQSTPARRKRDVQRQPSVGEEVDTVLDGKRIEREVKPPDTDSGLEPGEEKAILNALDADDDDNEPFDPELDVRDEP